MSDEVRAAYDSMAPLYAELFLGDLDGDVDAQRQLAEFAELASARAGVVVDLGCGPGHVVRHLVDRGVDTIGIDLSPGQIAQARTAFPDLEFRVGDLTALDLADASVGGIVSRYSIIHLPPDRLGEVFGEWRRVTEPEAPVLVSFFGSTSPDAHGTPFDHKVATAHELCPATIAAELRSAGFTSVRTDTRPPPDGGRPFDRATVLAVAPGG